ncbi:MAG: ABC transporter permease [Bacillales bacterium]|jgi:spermidine/putrescine transport system permease protein|nr:ABC transporter permease [Bacillales bacterium]
MKNKKHFIFSRSVFGVPYIVFLILFVVVPLFIIVIKAFSFKDPTTEVVTFSLNNFIKVFTTPTNYPVFLDSLIIAVLTTVFCILIGYPIAYLLANKKYNKSYILVLLFIMPMWINFVLRTYATRSLLINIGLNPAEIPYVTIMIGMIYNYLPFTILPLYTTMLKMDKSLLEASQDLGANNAQSFIKVVIPLSVPGIISAATMVFMPTMSSFVIVNVMGNNNITIIGNLIQSQFNFQLWNEGSALSLILLIIIGIISFFSGKLGKEQEKTALW